MASSADGRQATLPRLTPFRLVVGEGAAGRFLFLDGRLYGGAPRVLTFCRLGSTGFFLPGVPSFLSFAPFAHRSPFLLPAVSVNRLHASVMLFHWDADSKRWLPRNRTVRVEKQAPLGPISFLCRRRVAHV